MAATLTEAKVAWLQAAIPSVKTNLAELEYLFYSANSGLTGKKSVSDHKLAFFRTQAVVTSGSIADAERNWWADQAAPNNQGYLFYTTKPFGPVNLLTKALSDIETVTAWTPSGSTITRVTSNPREGSAALRVVTTVSSGYVRSDTGGFPAGYIPVVPGQLYTLLASFMGESVIATNQMQFRWIQSNGVASAILPTTASVASNNAIGTWQDRKYLSAAPADAAFVYVRLTTSAGSGTIFHIDRVGVFKGDVVSADWRAGTT